MAIAGADAGFRVGAVLSRSISILVGNAPVFGGLALLFTWPLLFVADDVGVDDRTVDPATGGATWAIGGGGAAAATIAAVVVVGLFVIALYMFATSSMVYGTVQALRGRRAGLGECIRQALPAIPRVVGIAVLTVLAILLVSALCAVPGLLIVLAGGGIFGGLVMFAAVLIAGIAVYAALWVAVPVAVVERLGVMDSLRRSTSLSKGHRWRVVGILVVLALLNGAAESIATLPFPSVSTGEPSSAESVVVFLVTAVFTAWGAIAAAVAYHDLRLEKEGTGVNEIAAVFD